MKPPAPTLSAAVVWRPIHLAAGALAVLAAAATVANPFLVRPDIGTGAWWPGMAVICVLLAAYLGASAVDHLARSRKLIAPPAAEPWLSILILILVWSVLARGPSSRLLLAGLGPAAACLAAASCTTLLVHLRDRVVLSPPAAKSAASWPLTAWRCALAALVLLGVMLLETRPLPTVKPWESPPSGVSKTKP